MANWFIIQSLESYSQHPDRIGSSLKEGSSEPKHGLFKEIKRGDKIAYYATGDMVIVGIFEVISESMEVMKDDKDWGTLGVYRIKPDVLPKDGEFVDFKSLLYSPDVSLELFPEKDKWRYKIWNHYIHRLSDNDLATIRGSIVDLKHTIKSDLTEPKVLTERLGIPVETANLLFEPIDEMGVVYIFASYHRKLGFPFIVRMRKRFPDVTAIDTRGEVKRIELEYRASNFAQHGHPPEGCDFLVCWENDWEEAPLDKLKIIPLKEVLADIFKPRM